MGALIDEVMAIQFFVRWLLDYLSFAAGQASAVRGRAAAARAVLSGLGRHGGGRVSRGPSRPEARDRAEAANRYAAMRALLGRHGWLVMLVLLVSVGDALFSWSSEVTTLRRGYQALPPPVRLAAAAGQSYSVAVAEPAYAPPQRSQLAFDPLAPALRAPIEISDSFRSVHVLQADDTLGDLALRYGVSLNALIWSNGLERGDALMVGQRLRIPRISGAPYVVSEGETVEEIAARLGVPDAAILAFGPNRLQDGQPLVAGSEIFVPGADLPPTESLLARGDAAALAQWSAEAAGVVLDAETNLREGPGTDYPRRLQLGQGRQVALRARHGNWLQVELAGVSGWVRTDLLAIADGLVDALPETDNFPPPPPRWVWPTRGTITSTFGPRWGAFHNGLDIANRAWTPIIAARSGWVREAGWCRGYGYCVKITHGGGVETIYGHLVAKPSVGSGAEVAAGELIGYMGSTFDRAGGGYSTGVHLHFTVLVNGRAVNPLSFLP